MLQDNIKDCLQKLRTALEDACIPPYEKLPTTPPDYIHDNRIKEKKRRSELKKGRKWQPSDYDWLARWTMHHSYTSGQCQGKTSFCTFVTRILHSSVLEEIEHFMEPDLASDFLLSRRYLLLSMSQSSSKCFKCCLISVVCWAVYTVMQEGSADS